VTAAPTLSSRRKAIILASCCLSLLIVSMDATIVNVAIPSVRADLGASAAQMQWVIDVYPLVLASLLLLAGAAADRFGRRRTFQIGLTVFALGSLLCSLAPNVETLIAARFVQGVGGSMMNPVAMSIITQVFTERVERARAIGVWGGVVGISMVLGPIVGGVLIELVDWRAVFWINLPICAIAIALTAIFVPESKSATMRDIDPVGQLLGIAFLFGVVFVLIEGPGMGWSDARTVGVAAAALIALAAFLVYESRRHDPFLDLRFFRSIPFSSATVIAVCAFAVWSAFLFMMSLYLQNARGFSPMQTGLIYLPMAIGALVFSPLSGRMVGRFGSRPSLVTSGVLLTGSAVLLAALTVTTPVWRVRGGQRPDHHRGGQRDADRPGGCGVGDRVDQPPGRRRPRRGAVRVAGRRGAGRHRRGIHRRRPAAVAGLCGLGRADPDPGALRDVRAGVAVGGTGGPVGDGRCPVTPTTSGGRSRRS